MRFDLKNIYQVPIVIIFQNSFSHSIFSTAAAAAADTPLIAQKE
jgi:hypothetical protein